MDKFTITTALRDFATSKGWKVIMGDEFYQNYQANMEVYDSGDIVMGLFPFITAIPRSSASFGEVTYRGVILLGRKFEDTTTASLDETFEQKYDRRLKELLPLLGNGMLEFACSNELEHSGELAHEINKFDTNIDFVGGLYTFYD